MKTLSKKEIKKWSNEQKVEALAKFIALKSFNPDKAILYGYMLDDLLDETNEKQIKIEQLETDKRKLIEKLEEIKEDMKQDQCTAIYYLKDIDEILKILKGENDE